MIETKRLILRPWRLEDAEALYEVAKTHALAAKPDGRRIRA